MPPEGKLLFIRIVTVKMQIYDKRRAYLVIEYTEADNGASLCPTKPIIDR